MSNSMIPNSYQSPNWLVDRLMQWLEPDEWVVLSFMVRHIMGWQDKIDSRRNRLSLSQFENGIGDDLGGCGLSRPKISTALKSLVKYRVIAKVGKATNEGQEWQLIDQPEIDWDGLKARKTVKLARSKKRIKKAAAASAAVRKNDETGTTVVPPEEYDSRTGTSTAAVPPDQYDSRTPSSTAAVPPGSTAAVPTKPNNKPNVVGGNNKTDPDPNQQQQDTPARDPCAVERQLFEQHRIAPNIWRRWMRHDAEHVVAAILHATQSDGVRSPVALMRAMLERGTASPAPEYVQAAREKLGRGEIDLDALEAAGWDPRFVSTRWRNGNGH